MNVVALQPKIILFFSFLCIFPFLSLEQNIPQKSLSFKISAGLNSVYFNEKSLKQKYGLINPSTNVELRYMRNKKWGVSGSLDLDIFHTKGKIKQNTFLMSPTLQVYIDLKNHSQQSIKNSHIHHYYHLGCGPGITTNESTRKRDIVLIAMHGLDFQKNFQKTYWVIGLSQAMILNQSYKLDMLSSNKKTVNSLIRLNIGMGFIIYSKYYAKRNRLDTTY